MTLRRYTALFSMLGLLCASPALAQATEEDPEPEVSDQGPYHRLLGVSVNGGLDTPVGVVGGLVEFAPIEFLNIVAGGGVSRSGARVAGAVQLRFPVHSTAFGLQAGVAGGPINWSSGTDNFQLERYWEFALFVHSALFIEYRWDEGIFGRLSFGAEGLAAGDVTECTRTDGTSCLDSTEGLLNPIRAWVGLTVGYAFEL